MGVMFAFASPVIPDEAIWNRAVGETGSRTALQDALIAAARPQQALAGFHNFANPLTCYQLGSDEMLISTLMSTQTPEELPLYALDVRLHVDGSATFSSGGIVQRAYGGSHLELSEATVADHLAAFLALACKLYELGGYHGFIDVGIAVKGIAETHSATTPARAFVHTAYNADEFVRTARVSVTELRDPKAVASSMLRALFEITTGDPAFDAFTWRPA